MEYSTWHSYVAGHLQVTQLRRGTTPSYTVTYGQLLGDHKSHSYVTRQLQVAQLRRWNTFRGTATSLKYSKQHNYVAGLRGTQLRHCGILQVAQLRCWATLSDSAVTQLRRWNTQSDRTYLLSGVLQVTQLRRWTSHTDCTAKLWESFLQLIPPNFGNVIVRRTPYAVRRSPYAVRRQQQNA
ncbi:unnamed protein product [Nesidiocoris tenuis]|uniref:Uncharacterized protein n=1 Tax=Nesidiocoris tenuis TaxID=355587 RepID=A0A6H5H576_9HEMI|nr:unnamed protein product [Nesidiocoris tenuis]